MSNKNSLSTTIFTSMAVSGVISYMAVQFQISSIADSFGSLITQNSTSYLEDVEQKIAARTNNSVVNFELDAPNDTAFLKSRLLGLFPGATIGSFEKLNNDYYKVTVNGSPIAIDSRGDTLLKGQLIDITGVSDSKEIDKAKIHNLTNNANNSKKLKSDAGRGENLVQNLQYQKAFDYITKNAIHYPAYGKTKQTVIIFGDNECSNCRKLHKQIPEMQKKGVEIYYALISIKGINSANGKVVDKILCSDEPSYQLDNAILGLGVQSDKTCQSPQKDFYYAALKIYEIVGTPTIFDRDGRKLSVSDFY